MMGTWELVLYISQNYDITIDWSLYIIDDDSTPLDMPYVGIEYQGSQLSTSSSGITTSEVIVNDDDIIDNFNVLINLSSSSPALNYLSLTLQCLG